MSEIYRVCAHCGGTTPLAARHCPTCGYDTQGGLPMQRQLPLAVGKAMLPVAASLAGLALRFGWRLLQSRWAQEAAKAAMQSAQAAQTTRPVEAHEMELRVHRPRRTIRIHSSWAIGDSNGIWRQGHEEHRIEIDD